MLPLKQQADKDEYWMQQALKLAQQAQDQGEVPIGAVLVINDELVGSGWNQPIGNHDPTAHAEIVALRAAAIALQNYRLPVNSTLYVTIEPCAMCTGALLHARVTRLVFGAPDPKAGAIISVFNLLDNRQLPHRTSWEGGCLKQACADILQAFFRARR